MATLTPGEANFETKLHEILSGARKPGAKFDARQLLQDQNLAVIASKLRHPRETTGKVITATGQPNDAGNTLSGVDQISRTIVSRVRDNENVFQLFPDIEICVQTIISSMLSPKDMSGTNLIYKLENNRFPANLSSKLMEIVREELEKTYKLRDRVYDIFRDALFVGGSHPVGIFPEAAVDYLINTPRFSVESAISNSTLFLRQDDGKFSIDKVRNVGLLGDPHTTFKPSRLASLETSYTYPDASGYNAKLWANESKLLKSWENDPELEKIFSSPESGIKTIVTFATESIEVIDNSDVLRLPALLDRVTEARIQEEFIKKRRVKLTAAVENFSLSEKEPGKRVSPEVLNSTLYKGSDLTNLPYMAVPAKHNLKRRSVGRPLEITFPAQSLIPIHTPGDHRKHVAYFCVLDAEGTPITYNDNVNEYGQNIASTMNSDRNGQTMSGLLTDRAKKNLISDNYTPVINKMTDIYADVVERDLLERLSRGIYNGKEMRISKDNDIFRVMLYRALKGHFTRILFIPAEYITYFAFDYHTNGVGRSYLDQLSSITSLRAMVLYSKVWAQVRSSIETTDVKINFDPRDPDPINTVEIVENLVARSRQQIFPNGLRRVADFTDWLQRAGIRMSFEGHPRLPNTSLSFESTKIDHAEPNNELEETLRHMTYMHFGLSPEQVDDASKSDFATTVENRGILFSKRINMLDDCASQDLTGYVQKVIRYDTVLQERIVKAFIECKAEIEHMLTDEERNFYEQGSRVEFTEYLIELFIDSVKIDLPRPESTTNENIKREVDGYESIIDKVLSYVIDTEILPAEYVGEASEYIASLSKAWKAVLMRRFFADNNIAPEVFEIASLDEDGQPMVNMLKEIENHSETVQMATVELLKRMKERRDLVAKDLEKINPGASSVSSDTGGESDDNANSNPFGRDDLGFGDDLGLGDEGGPAAGEGGEGDQPTPNENEPAEAANKEPESDNKSK